MNFGRGLVFSKYTGARGKSGCNDANPEFVAWLKIIVMKHLQKIQVKKSAIYSSFSVFKKINNL